MRSSHKLARVETTFDEDNLVPNAVAAPGGIDIGCWQPSAANSTIRARTRSLTVVARD